jgi:Tfp pilus assembly protein PilX
VVLVIALIVLVAMTLAGIALVRSVDTTNVIAGNLAFHQAATHSGDQGVEAAITWLTANNTTTLFADNYSGTPASSHAYLAARSDPANGQSWDAFWNATLAGQAATLPADAGGNTISYVIHRMCQSVGDPAATSCSFAPACNTNGQSQVGGNAFCAHSRQPYYRITSRIVGPRNTVSYIQAIVAM